MPIYIAVPLKTDGDPLATAIKLNIHESDRYELQAERGWLIHFSGTTKELSDKIGLTGQPKGESSSIGSAIVVPVSGYYGRGPTDMWEWLKTRLEQ